MVGLIVRVISFRAVAAVTPLHPDAGWDEWREYLCHNPFYQEAGEPIITDDAFDFAAKEAASDEAQAAEYARAAEEERLAIAKEKALRQEQLERRRIAMRKKMREKTHAPVFIGKEETGGERHIILFRSSGGKGKRHYSRC